MSEHGSDSQSSFLDSGDLIAERYIVKRLLGAGGSGYVVLAEDNSLTGTLVVVKLLYSHLLQDERAFQRFRNETSIAFNLSHPNIVQTYSFEVWQECGFFITMEYLPGGSLQEQLDKHFLNGFDFDVLLNYLRMMLQGLQYAHRRGVIHRDIKPHNLLLNDENELKIADFGLSQMLWGEIAVTRAGDVLGTPHYMSPEQFEAKAIDTRSDIYSLGISTFQLACGSLPFEANTMYELAMRHLHDPLPTLKEFGVEAPLWFQEFLNSCCQKNPDERFSSVGEAAAFLKEHSGVGIEDIQHTAPNVKDDREQLVRMQAIIQNRFRNRILLSLILILPIITAIYARQHPPLMRRLAGAVLWLEYTFDQDLPLTRSFFGVTIQREDRSCFFDFAQRTRCVWPLLQGGMDPNFRNDDGQTPLHYFTEGSRAFQDTETMRRLIASGADINAKDRLGRTPLISCVQSNSPLCAKFLLDQGANGDLVDNEGKSALEHAIRNSNATVVQTLLEGGVSPTTIGSTGVSLLDIAKTTNNKEVEKLLADALSEKTKPSEG